MGKMDCQKELPMFITFLFPPCARIWGQRRQKPALPKVKPLFVPRLMALEDRTLPSTFAVMNLADGGPGSLRLAIMNANLAPGADVIQFAPGLKGSISLTSGPLSVQNDLTILG